MQDFSKHLISWYLKNKRDLPWRNTINPYKIWLSEIILQQTRVTQGLPYYLKFTTAFPTVIDLANASEEEVLKLWQGLGYYSRARNLHTTAKYVANDLNGVFPNTYQELKKLKGVGDYTASAIASFCFQEPKAVLDGNVYRVLARLYGIDTPINTTEGVKTFSKLSQVLLDVQQPDVYNQAIMEFGARQCTPKKADCASCMFNSNCIALKDDLVGALPVKLKKGTVKKRYFNYIVPITNGKRTVLKKREEKGIWANLYEFPLIETENKVEFEELLRKLNATQLFSKPFELSLYNDKPIIHKLSHQHINTRFWVVETGEPLEDTTLVSELHSYPVPVLIANFINEFSF